MGAHLASPYLPASPGPPHTCLRGAGSFAAGTGGQPVRHDWDFVAHSSAAGTTFPRFGAALVGVAAACAGRARRVARAASPISYQKLYKPLSPESDLRKGPQKVNERAAPWRKDNARLREDESWSKQVVWDPARRGSRGRRYSKSMVVDLTEEKERRAAALRAVQKRPRFSWKEVMQDDDPRTSQLSEELPAIGYGEVWLSKFLAHAGACSRRKVTQLVLQGRVMVNDQVVQEPAMKVNPKKDKVMVDGQPQTLQTLGQIIWIMLNKPKGVISTFKDSEDRKTVMDLVPFARRRRLVPVGRIDRNAAGLMLLTNDYEWHTIMAHPRHEHSKRYKVQALQGGLELPDEPLPLLPLEDFEYGIPDKVQEIATLKFSLKQGRYRQIRRMFEFIGHPVRSIKRIAFGLLQLDRRLKAGDWRMLTAKEIRQLKGPTILKRPGSHPVLEERELQTQIEEIERAEEAERQDDHRDWQDRRGPEWEERGSLRVADRRGSRRRETKQDRRSRREDRSNLEFVDLMQPAMQRRQDPSEPRWGDPRGAKWEDRWEDQEGEQEQGQWEREWEENERARQRKGRGLRRDSVQVRGGSERARGRGRRERRWKSELPALGRARVRTNLGRPPGELWDEPRRSEEPQEATVDDLVRLQQRFDSLPAVSSSQPELENNWEKNWVQQLDAMQAERSEQPRAA